MSNKANDNLRESLKDYVDAIAEDYKNYATLSERYDAIKEFERDNEISYLIENYIEEVLKNIYDCRCMNCDGYGCSDCFGDGEARD